MTKKWGMGKHFSFELFCLLAFFSLISWPVASKPVPFGYSLLPDEAKLDLGKTSRGMAVVPDTSVVVVANFDADSVEIIDRVSGQPAVKVSVGDGPVDVALNPDQNTAYIVNLLSDDMSVVSLKPAQLLSTVKLGISPRGVVVSPNGKYVFVTCLMSNEVVKIDSATLEIAQRVRLGSFPRGIAITPDGKRVLVTARFTSRLSVLDAQDLSEAGSVELPEFPTAVGVEANGKRALVACPKAGEMAVVDLHDLKVVQRLVPTDGSWKTAVGELPLVWTPGAPEQKVVLDLDTRIDGGSNLAVLLEDTTTGEVKVVQQAVKDETPVTTIQVAKLAPVARPPAPAVEALPAARPPEAILPRPPAPTVPIVQPPAVPTPPTAVPAIPPIEAIPGIEPALPELTPEQREAGAVAVGVLPQLTVPFEAAQPVTAPGRFLLARGDMTLEGEEVEYHRDTGLVIAHHNLKLMRGAAVLYGDSGEYNMETQQGVVNNARGQADMLYYRSPKLERLDENHAVAHDASLTTCDLDTPHYQLKASELDIVRGEDGVERIVARHAKLYIGPVPIFYWPRFTQELGTGKDRPHFEFHTGKEHELGYYLRTSMEEDLTDNFTGTFRLDGYTKKGVGLGFDGEYKKLLDTGSGNFKLYGTSQEEGRAEFYHRQELPGNWVALLQAEQWSDEDFLFDFYYDEFKKRTEPETFVNLTRAEANHVISLTAKKRTMEGFTTTEKLPELNADLLEYRLGDTNFFIAANNAAGYYQGRPKTDEIDSLSRNDSTMRLSYVQNFSTLLRAIPFVEYEGTLYSRDLDDDSSDYRAQANGGIETSTRFQRDFDVSIGSIRKIRHIVIPTVVYAARDKGSPAPSDLRQLDSIDDRPGRSRVESKLDQTFVAKFEDGTVRPIAKWLVFNGADANAQEEETINWESDLLFYPTEKWTVGMEYDQQDAAQDFKRFNSGISYGRDKDVYQIKLGFAYSETDEGVQDQDIIYGFKTKLTDKWRIGFEQRYDFHDDDLEYQEYELYRDLHCWEATLKVRDREKSTDVMFVVSLKAFPDAKIKF